MLGSSWCKSLPALVTVGQVLIVVADLQASAKFPENTLASFEAAMRDGAEGIESGI